MFEWLDDAEEFFSCARFVVVAMMRVDGISNNVVADDKVAFIPQSFSYKQILQNLQGFLLFGWNPSPPTVK